MLIPVREAELPPSDPVPLSRAPRLRLIANGQVLTGALEAEVVSNNYYAADRFSATVALGPDRWADAAFWAAASDVLVEVQLSLDGGTSFVSLIQGAVDDINIDPIRGLVHVDGRDFTAALIEARTQETFANRTSSEIASLLAQRRDLTPHVAPTRTPIGRYYQSEHDRTTLDQFSRTTTEWDLLVFLARHEGFDLFIQGRALYFQPAAQSVESVLTLTPMDVLDLRLGRSLTLARDIEVVVKSWNSRQNSALAQRASTNGPGSAGRSGSSAQHYVFMRPNMTPDEALRFAQRKIAELARHERAVRISIPGELALTPRSMIAIDGTATSFDQIYYIDVIERRFRQNDGLIEHVTAHNSSAGRDAATEIAGSGP
jgi:phage protein D